MSLTTVARSSSLFRTFGIMLQAQQKALRASSKRCITSTVPRVSSVRAVASLRQQAARFAGSRFAPAPLASKYATVCKAVAEEYGASGSEGPEEPTNQCFVSNLAWTTTSDGLADHFAQVSGFSRAMVMMRDGRSRGMGLVEFETPDQAAQAIETLNGSSLDGRNINVRESRPAPQGERRPREYAPRDNDRREYAPRGERQQRAPAAPGATLYVRNLSFRTEWQELKDHFKAVGYVERVSVVKGQDGRSRGFGYVQFSSAEDAQRAMEALDGSMLDDREIQVAVHIPRQQE